MRRLLLYTILILSLENRISSFKTLENFKEQYKKVNQDFTTSDALVGRAMDFIYSNKTIMSLIARELWNVGSRAIDTIVDVKGKEKKKSKK
ncbi:unnamed protein product [Pieris macdunnoughi]|uniref:Uncharacterized protein n=1 Tax=Pieris macdunnoughi TaxID=345717 RepID=A0A821S727_9NEOP|nr:unnamed protein product [Pieris macdunnoughi]